MQYKMTSLSTSQLMITDDRVRVRCVSAVSVNQTRSRDNGMQHGFNTAVSGRLYRRTVSGVSMATHRKQYISTKVT